MSIRYRMIDATAVPKIPSAATDPSALALGTWSGIWKRESGSRTTAPQMTADVAVTSGGGRREAVLREEVRAGVRERGDDDRERAGDRPPPALRMEPREHADPGQAEQDAGETHPGDTLARVISDRQEATKIGTVAFAIAAIPESTYFSPHAISVNGIAPLITPSMTPPQPVARRAAIASRRPILATRNASRTTPASISRSSIIGDRLDLVHRDLDEEIGRAPERRQREQERQVGARHGARLPSGRGFA